MRTKILITAVAVSFIAWLWLTGCSRKLHRSEWNVRIHGDSADVVQSMGRFGEVLASNLTIDDACRLAKAHNGPLPTECWATSSVKDPTYEP